MKLRREPLEVNCRAPCPVCSIFGEVRYILTSKQNSRFKFTRRFESEEYCRPVSLVHFFSFPRIAIWCMYYATISESIGIENIFKSSKVSTFPHHVQILVSYSIRFESRVHKSSIFQQSIKYNSVHPNLDDSI